MHCWRAASEIQHHRTVRLVCIHGISGDIEGLSSVPGGGQRCRRGCRWVSSGISPVSGRDAAESSTLEICFSPPRRVLAAGFGFVRRDNSKPPPSRRFWSLGVFAIESGERVTTATVDVRPYDVVTAAAPSPFRHWTSNHLVSPITTSHHQSTAFFPSPMTPCRIDALLLLEPQTFLQRTPFSPSVSSIATHK